jgi:hypothetical protein
MNNMKQLPGLMLAAYIMLAGACKTTMRNENYFVEKDSCIITITKSDQPVNGTAANNNYLNYSVVLNTSRKLGEDAATMQRLLFSMDDKFELVSDSLRLLPVFCQPVASGIKGKFIYLVSFEQPGTGGGDKTIVIHPNNIIRDSIHYKIF